MRIHFISIGGAVMHNLALELQALGHLVSGSDDEIFEPALGRLQHAGLLPEGFGWFPEKLDSRPDCVILGMHARKDNPELLRALDTEARDYLSTAKAAAGGASKGPVKPHYFTMLKQLSIFTFFTSQVGANEALQYVAVPGRYDGDMPYVPGTPAWATD